MVSTDQIKELREKTGISIAECKKALEVASGDMERALGELKKRGAETMAKKSDRALSAGAIAAYLHGGTIGALVELQAETDFVAKNEEFKVLADDLAMQVAAMNPQDLEELLVQPFIKDPGVKVGDLISAATQKFGERVKLVRFSRLSAGN